LIRSTLARRVHWPEVVGREHLATLLLAELTMHSGSHLTRSEHYPQKNHLNGPSGRPLIESAMNIYGNALMGAKREANSKVVRMALRSA
jgi:hypothetical protein